MLFDSYKGESSVKKIISMLVVLVIVSLMPLVAEAKKATLTWTLSTEEDLEGYQVFRERTCSVAEDERTQLQIIGKVNTYEDATVPEDWTEVCYWLKARDFTGNKSAFSNSARKAFLILLPAPGNLKYVSGVFSWDAVVGATGYLLRVHEQGTPYTPCQSMVFCNALGTLAGTSQAVALKFNTQYDVWIHSHDVNKVFGPSSGISFKTELDNVPPKVPVLSITKIVGEDSIVMIVITSKVHCDDVALIQDATVPETAILTCVR